MIHISDATKDYGSFKLNINMDIGPGQITGIVGKNGAGKSTTIKLILGLINADLGRVVTMGKPAGELSVEDKQEFGVALSEALFCKELNANDVNKILKKMYKKYDEAFFLNNLKQQRIDLNKAIKDYSTGMRAKLRVLIALSHNAKLLILDEPTAGLDVEARNDILDMLRNYVAQDDERTILISSHISSDLESLCDDIYLIHDGEVILHEETDSLLGQYGVLKVDEKVYEELDKTYVIKTAKTAYGYACFTSEKQFYAENYPGIVIENGSIDDLILIMTGGYK